MALGSADYGPGPDFASLVTLQDKKGFNADKSRCTQNTQIVQYDSKTVDHALDLQARLTEIKQQAEPQAGRFEIIGALHPVRIVPVL
jgi:hypothetical protein